MDAEAPIEIDETDFLQDDMVCSVCSAEFLDKVDLEVHIRQIHLNNINKTRFCQLCTHIFNDIEEYALHLRNTHLGSFKCCKYCTRLFKSTLEVQEHEKRHNAAVLYPKVSCSHCKNVFDSKKEIQNHELKEHSDSDEGLLLRDCLLPILSSLLCMNVHDFLTSLYSNLPYMCVKCDETTVDGEAYIQHLVNNKCHSLACDKCCNVFTYKSKLSRHIELHSRFKIIKLPALKLQCSKCKLSFNRTKLKSHKKMCAGMSCTVCNLAFNTVDEYSQHKLDKHSTKLPALKVCHYCQRQLLGEECMKKHVDRVHKHEKHLYKYRCTDCNRVFKHPKLLFAHFFSMHKNLQPYTCKICDKKFRVRKGFSLHIKLTHKSVGFVEFDDNFHVYFTDKKSKTHKASANADDDQNGEDLIEDECNANTEAAKNDYSDDHMLEKSDNELHELENEFNPKDVDVTKSNDKESKIIGVQAVTDENHVDSENKKNLKVNKDNKRADCLLVKRLGGRKRKLNIVKKHTEQTSGNIDISSDDSDIPLGIVSNKLKSQKMMSKKTRKSRNVFSKNPRTKKFICDKCDRNCYTYQNFHRHRALHFKNETKVCIKCYGKFDSVKKLDEHIKKEHSSSQLTEALKKLLEKRKIEETKAKEAKKAKEIAKSKEIVESEEIANPDEINQEVKMCLSNTEKFHNTIKKLRTERTTTTKVTMKLVNKDQISVKKYLENFMQDNNEVKITMIKNPLSLVTRIKKPKPLIKLTKFTPEPIRESQEVNLRMPVKFTDSLREKFDVQIKLVSESQPPAMKFCSEIDNSLNFTDETYVNSYDDYDTFDATEEVVDSKDAIPEVAEEVIMEGTETENNIVHIKNLPKWHNVQIAHLAPEAPYFKITKINLENSLPLTPEKDEGIKHKPEDVTLPSGKKLVSVNPYKHLLNKNTIEGLKTSKKKCAYKPRISNVAEAIKTALEKLEQTPMLKAKKK